MRTEAQIIPKGYMQTDMGMLPSDWDIYTGEQITTLIGKGASPRWQGFNYTDNGMLFVTSENVRDGYLDIREPKYLPLAFHERLRRTQIHKGDILINLVGASIGRSCQVATDLGDANVNQAVAVFRVRSPFSARYIAYCFQSAKTIERIFDMQVDAARPNISLGNLRHFKLPIPRRPAEQDAIAEALSDADMLIESLKQLLAKKLDVKQGAMQELLTGKRRLPGFSRDWRTLTLGTCFNISGGLSASRDQLSHDGHCYLHYGDIHGSCKSFIDVDAELSDIPKLNVSLSAVSPASLLGDGDVVFVDASEDVDGTSKHVVIANPHNIPFISGLHTIVAKPKTNDLEPFYCRYCFHTEAVKAQFRFFAVGTKVSGVSKTNIAKIELAVPEPKEQLAIADILVDMDAEISLIETKLSKARHIRQGMMQELLTGRIRLV